MSVTKSICYTNVTVVGCGFLASLGHQIDILPDFPGCGFRVDVEGRSDHANVMATLRIRVDFDGGASIGPGKIELLEAVSETGSIRAAAKRTGMSFRRAWLLLQDTEGLFGEALIQTTRGGPSGGGTVLTTLGAFIVETYRDLEDSAQSAAQQKIDALGQHVRPAPALAGQGGRARKTLKK